MQSELVPEQRGTAIGFNVFAAAMIGTFRCHFWGRPGSGPHRTVRSKCGLAAAWLLIAPVIVGVPETAPRMLARYETTRLKSEA